ncbi:uncharacterized protein LOC126736511 [Anthonomus grandis grandis]|uniref:uncharacterized protein LOC126736511 n=1 Tax=Anthonomus grandis grandis TaxID=2921223 RepID=UPI0021664040|nr:uncharacterized protein LOC126736511 [Anthonomus grandis grandis]
MCQITKNNIALQTHKGPKFNTHLVGFMLSPFYPYVPILLWILLCHCHAKDLLQLFRPKPDLPNELNDFLTDVQHHKDDFAFIRHVAKNQRKYQNSYLENQHLFGEEIDNQLTVNPERGENARENDVDKVGQLLPTPSPLLESFRQEPNSLLNSKYGNLNFDLDALTQDKSLKSLFPQPRYSKYLHSPIRFRRELEDNYLNQRVKTNSEGKYGNIRREEPKFPDNKYHTGYVVDDHEEYDDYDADEGKKQTASGNKH